MNKAITDGIQFMPTPFAEGLQNYSSEDGRPGQPTYDGAANASLVAADADFGTCLEMQKTETVQKLRYTGETPILQSTYIRVTARIKAISGSLPLVRIAAWAGDSADQEVTGIPVTATDVQITGYGEIFEIAAIIGPGTRTGVDLAWGSVPVFAHVGIDLTGPNGGIVRVDDLRVEDISSVFISKQLGIVDVRDFGALGDGVTDDADAFEAADAAANGRDLIVPAGDFYIGRTITINTPVKFEGTLTMPVEARLELLRSFDYPTYADAFGDEEIGFKKAIQALINSVDHQTLDLGGRLISIHGPIDVQAVVHNKTQTLDRRIIANGQIRSEASANWATHEVTETASYNPNIDQRKLTGVTNIGGIEVGSLVTGNGVGREVYVLSKDEGAGELELSQALHGGIMTQAFTFTRFRYQLDMLGFSKAERLIFENVNFNMRSNSSGIMLPQDGNTLIFRDCHFNRAKDRCITSVGTACHGMTLERNQFISDEVADLVTSRKTIAVNAQTGDLKIKDNRAVRFKHFLITNGANLIISGNHVWQGDNVASKAKTASFIFTEPFACMTLSDNYIDNSYIEWNNEHAAFPENAGSSFSGMTITGNMFYCSAANPWFNFISIKPYGINHYLNGINISDNNFKMYGDTIDDAVAVDTTFADLYPGIAREFTMSNNTFDNVTHQVSNPITVEMNQVSANATWSKHVGNALPFGLRAKFVTALAPVGEIETNTGTNIHEFPAITTEAGGDQKTIELNWSTPVRGTMMVTVKGDRVLTQT